jgi:hypothetical protein
MTTRSRRRDTPTQVTRADFVRDPASVLRMAEAARRPILITDDRGKPSAIVSAPRDGRDEHR